MISPIVEGILEEQIASLRASAAVFDQGRAQALASAQDLAVQAGGARARANEVQAALDALRADGEPEPEPEPESGAEA